MITPTDAIRTIVKHQLVKATMRLSLHKSLAQAQNYYDDVDLQDNPATYLLG